MAAANITFLLFFLLPFQFALLGGGAIDLPIARLIIPILFLLWLARGLFLRKLFLPRPLTLFSLSAFLLFSFFSLFWSLEPGWALRKVLFWLSFFPLFLILIDVFRTEKVKQSALHGLIGGAAAVAFVGVAQFVSQFFLPLPYLLELSFATLHFFLGANFAQAVALYPSMLVNIEGGTLFRAFAFFPDPHIFSYYLGMILPLALYQAKIKKSRWYAFLGTLILLGIILSFSRASYIAIAGTAFFLGALIAWQHRKNIPILPILAGLTLLIVILLSPIASRLQSTFSGEDLGVRERSRLLSEAIVNIERSPFIGVGLGNYPLLVKPSALAREPIYVHNLYLDLTAEVGVIGLLLFLLFVASSLPRFPCSQHPRQAYRLALFSSLSIFLLHSLFEYPLFSVHVLTLFLTLAALLYVEKRKR